MDWKATWVCVGLVCGADLKAQPAPSPAAVDEAVRVGTVAALAPLCGMRDDAWASDLRRGAILEGTRTGLPDDSALKAAPGSDLIVGALSFAEEEALESFAEEPPEAACGKLARGSDLSQADALVERFRKLRSGSKVSS